MEQIRLIDTHYNLDFSNLSIIMQESKKWVTLEETELFAHFFFHLQVCDRKGSKETTTVLQSC